MPCKQQGDKIVHFCDICNILSQHRSHFQAGYESNCIRESRDDLKDKHCLINPGDWTAIACPSGHFVIRTSLVLRPSCGNRDESLDLIFLLSIPG